MYPKRKNWLLLALLTAMGVYGCGSASKVADDKPMTQAEKELAAERAAAEARAKAESDAAAIAMQEEEGVKVKKKKDAGDNASRKSKKKKSTRKAEWAGGVIVVDDDDQSASGTSGSTSAQSKGKNAKGSDSDKASESVAEHQPRMADGQSEEDMMGMPTVNYVVKGRVVNEAGKPVEGMQVVLANANLNITPQNLNLGNEQIRQKIELSADTTAANGTFRVRAEELPSDYLRIFVRDIDGPSHGNYENDVINVSFDESDTKDTGHGWRKGTMEKRLTIKVKPRR